MYLFIPKLWKWVNLLLSPNYCLNILHFEYHTFNKKSLSHNDSVSGKVNTAAPWGHREHFEHNLEPAADIQALNIWVSKYRHNQCIFLINQAMSSYIHMAVKSTNMCNCASNRSIVIMSKGYISERCFKCQISSQ